ncbi:GNAT family N-acetyltransferase [Candidatus Bathyarchaeota archaeon]|nr:MAG: GNAT family N-acetyltransferase [Candidatus Bathyarchaeota archaeon]
MHKPQSKFTFGRSAAQRVHMVRGDQLNGQDTKAGGKGLQGSQENRENHCGRIPSLSEDHYVRVRASYVAEIRRNLVGFTLVQPTSFVHSAKRELWLEYIAVRPASKRKGIGTMLMSTVIEYANTQNISFLYTTLNPNNSESIQFLTMHGFEVKDWKEASKKLTQ